jgi:hypothetical protein
MRRAHIIWHPAIAVSLLTAIIIHVGGGADPSRAAQAVADDPGTYLGVTPARVLDTRTGVGAPATKLGPATTIDLHVLGNGGVPTTDVTAVALNVTVVDPTAQSYVTVWPTGAPQPNASNLNFTAGTTIPNLVIAKVGTNGNISLYNHDGTTHLLADIVGYFTDGEPPPGDPAPTTTTTATTATTATATTIATTSPPPTTAPTPTTSTATTTSPPGTVEHPPIVEPPEGGWPLLVDLPESFVLRPGAVMPSTADILGVAGSAMSGGAVVLRDGAALPAVGGHLAVFPIEIAPDGIAGRVVAVTAHPDGGWTLTLASANLQDVFSELVIHDTGSSTTPLAPEQVHAVGRFPRSVPLIGPNETCSAGVSVVGAPDIGLELGGSFDFDLSERSARLELTGTVTLSWSVAVSGSISCTFEVPSVPLGVIGPATIEGGYEIEVSISAEVSGELQVQVPVVIGFEYDDGDATNLSSVNPSGTATYEGATVQLSAGAFATSAVKLFGIVGIELAQGPVVTAELADDCLELSVGYSVSMSAEIGRWGVGWSIELADFSPAPKRVGQFGSCPTPTVVAGSTLTYEISSQDDGGGSYSGTLMYVLGGVTDPDQDIYSATVTGTITRSQDGCVTDEHTYTGQVRAYAVTARAEQPPYISNAVGPNFGIRVGSSTEEDGSYRAISVPCGELFDRDADVAGPTPIGTGFKVVPVPDSDPDPLHIAGSYSYDSVINGSPSGTETTTMSYDITFVEPPS